MIRTQLLQLMAVLFVMCSAAPCADAEPLDKSLFRFAAGSFAETEAAIGEIPQAFGSGKAFRLTSIVVIAPGDGARLVRQIGPK